MKKQIIKLAPKIVLRWYGIYREKRELRKSNRLKKEKTITQEEVDHVLEKCDLDCDIYLHTSLRKIGYSIEGGKEFVADTICNHVDLKEHTLLVSALPYRTLTRDFLEENSALNIATAPNAMGAVNNIIMRKEGSFRSLHPTHSTVAIGKTAEEYVKDHHLDKTPFGPHSPYYKLMINNGKVLLFGVDLDSMTFTHVIEDMLGCLYPVKVYVDKQYEVDVTDLNSKVHHVITTCHNPEVSSIRNCESIRKQLMESGAMNTFPLGMSEVSIIDTKGYVKTVCRLLLQGKSIYGDVRLSNDAIVKVNEIINNI